MHGAAFAAFAIAHHGFAASLFSYHTYYYGGNDTQQHSANNDIAQIAYDPVKHLFHLNFQFSCFFIGFEQHKQHACYN